MNDFIFYCAGSSRAQIYAAAFLMEEGVSFLPCPDHTVTHLLLPVPSFEADGSIKGGGDLGDILNKLPRTVTVIGGNLNRPELSEYEVLDLLEDPWYLARNASITAHCALELALEKLPVTLEKCPVLILGWGRIGKCLSDLLQKIGTPVTIAARNESDRAMASALGHRAVDFSGIGQEVARHRLLFNTVPQGIVLQKPSPGCVKIDLASLPGLEGDDVIPARGLPGKYAPESAGKLIAESIIRLTREE